jgi:ferric-dicitrate binding protein FerR (iron transport regulator)
MSHLDELTHRFLEDQLGLSPEDLDQLIDGLRADPARAMRLRDQMVVDCLIAQKLSLDRQNFPAQVAQRVADFQESEQAIDSQVLELRELAAAEMLLPAQRPKSSNWMGIVIALSLVAGAIGVFYVPRFLPQAPIPVAKVTAVEGRVVAQGSSDRAALVAAATLFSGQRIEIPAGAQLSLEYADRTSLSIVGGSQVSLEVDEYSGAKRVRVETGEVWARVAPQPAGAPMVFHSPHATATVLGTELRFTVAGRETWLQVTTGQVQLDRVAGGPGMIVSAGSQGIASEEKFERSAVHWPDDSTGQMYWHDPFSRRILVRNPTSADWLETPLAAYGSALVDPNLGWLELSGGYFESEDAGVDLARLLQDAREFSLEVVLRLPESKPQQAGTVLSLVSGEGKADMQLEQQEERWRFTLQSAESPDGNTIEFAPVFRSGRAHLTICYRVGEMVVYQDGQPLESESEPRGLPGVWQAKRLVIGPDQTTNGSWQGSIEALSIGTRWLAAEEVQRNVRNYGVLAGRVP